MRVGAPAATVNLRVKSKQKCRWVLDNIEYLLKTLPNELKLPLGTKQLIRWLKCGFQSDWRNDFLNRRSGEYIQSRRLVHQWNSVLVPVAVRAWSVNIQKSLEGECKKKKKCYLPLSMFDRWVVARNTFQNSRSCTVDITSDAYCNEFEWRTWISTHHPCLVVVGASGPFDFIGCNRFIWWRIFLKSLH